MKEEVKMEALGGGEVYYGEALEEKVHADKIEDISCCKNFWNYVRCFITGVLFPLGYLTIDGYLAYEMIEAEEW